jgi:cell wall assembly regulator SMI1
MSATSLDTPLDDLDLSVRTYGLLCQLGVTTLGELFAVPEIKAPARVIAELTALLDEHGLDFPGELVVDQPEVIAAGDLDTRWTTITAWLEAHRPDVLAELRPPADAAAIAAAEAALGQALPADYRRFLALHDGQLPDATMVGTCALIPVGELAATYHAMRALFDVSRAIDADLAGEGVRAVEWSPGWLPIGRSARGRDFLCLDLDPAPGGTSGQVIEVIVDFDDRPRVADSFTALLALFFTQLQTGDLGEPEDLAHVDDDLDD